MNLWKLTALSLSAFLLSGCCVSTKVIKVDKNYWLASKYLEAGDQVPITLDLTTKMVPVSLWLAVIKSFTGFFDSWFSFQEKMYSERITTYCFGRCNHDLDRTDKRNLETVPGIPKR